MAGNAATGDSLKRRSPGGQARASDNAINLGIDYMSEAIKIPTNAQLRKASYNSPESMLQPPVISSLDQIEDALTCVLSRCEAQVSLMFIAVESGNLADRVLLNSLWLLQGQVEQMQAMIRARAPHQQPAQVRATA